MVRATPEALMLESLNKLRVLWSRSARDEEIEHRLDEMRAKTPAPVLWLFGKTQSGKTSIIKYLTGADAAEIGNGFQPCTRYSRMYRFPTPEAPLVTFLDTRGLDEPGYDPAEDLAHFNHQAHLVVVTVKALDHAQMNVIDHLGRIRHASPKRQVLLALTCLHEGYPQKQHPQPYPFTPEPPPGVVPEDLTRSLAEQRRRFGGLFDAWAAIDLTRPEEGFEEPNYGGDRLKDALLELLPHAYGQTLRTLELATHELKDLHARRALPYVVGYSTLAATAGAFPVPFVDLLVLPGIQAQMIGHIARLYGHPLTAKRFMEVAGSLGLGIVARQAVREVSKVVPVIGAVAGAALAGASTFALGKAFCYYYQAVHEGRTPDPAELKRYYQEQLAAAEAVWKKS
jgi:uncharacterized protein (DUF697 family)